MPSRSQLLRSLAATAVLATLVTAPVTTTAAADLGVPAIRSIDRATGRGLPGMAVGGESCTRWGNDLNFTCVDFETMAWSDMATTTSTAGPSEIPVRPDAATSCEQSSHRLTFSSRRTPRGHLPIRGELQLCLLASGWTVISNSTGGGIAYRAAANEIVFRFRPRTRPAATTRPRPRATTARPRATAQPTRFPATGGDPAPFALIAGILSLTGAALVVAARLRRTS